MTDSLITSFLMSPVGMLTLILVASVASAALGWLLRDRRASTVNAELALVQDENLRLRDQAQVQHESLSQFKDELEQSRNQISALQLESARQQEQLNAAQLREASLQQRLDESVRQVSELQTESQSVRNQLVKEQETRVQQERSAEEKLALLNESRENLLKDFEHLSQKIFEQKTKQFSEQSQQGISSLLTPFREQLDGLKKKVEDVYVSDTRDRASLKAQIGELHKLNQQITAEAHALTIALKGEKKKQGNWGELVLETVLEKSGLREGEEFVRERSLNNDEGKRYRPDVIINLPDDKHIIVDAKVSLNAYTEYVNAEDETQRQQFARAHCDAVRQHIRSLSEKAYQQLEGLNSPDFVFMFMPVEPAFITAFEHDDALFSDAFEQCIVVVTPTTLLATLRTVASIWAIERRNKHTEKLAEQAGKLYDKLAIVVDRMETMGKQLGTVQGTYEDTWKALKGGRGNLVSQADQFRKLGVRVKKELPKALVDDANAEHEVSASDELSETDSM